MHILLSYSISLRNLSLHSVNSVFLCCCLFWCLLYVLMFNEELNVGILPLVFPSYIFRLIPQYLRLWLLPQKSYFCTNIVPWFLHYPHIMQSWRIGMYVVILNGQITKFFANRQLWSCSSFWGCHEELCTVLRLQTILCVINLMLGKWISGAKFHSQYLSVYGVLVNTITKSSVPVFYVLQQNMLLILHCKTSFLVYYFNTWESRQGILHSNN